MPYAATWAARSRLRLGGILHLVMEMHNLGVLSGWFGQLIHLLVKRDGRE